jgi:glutathione synthase/RimK-type ligase-like ATP-grasp enzyme
MPIEAVVAEIAEEARRLSVDVILPSDVVSTRLLTLIADQLPVRTCSVPDPATFENLNDKWWFYNFCRRENLPTPQTWLFETSQDLWNALHKNEIPLPVIVKPTNKMGSSGIFTIKAEQELARLLKTDYRPLLVQKYVEGQDCGLAMVCDRGRVVAYEFQRHFNWGASRNLRATGRSKRPAHYCARARQRRMARRGAAKSRWHSPCLSAALQPRATTSRDTVDAGR